MQIVSKIDFLYSILPVAKREASLWPYFLKSEQKGNFYANVDEICLVQHNSLLACMGEAAE